VWRNVVESYGYEQYNASILEPAELYSEKTNEEHVLEQTYTFTDRGDRKVTLRPEMTPTVARLIAARRRELAYPVRWYSIPNVFRYERPQRGRLREHWQLNVDTFGIESLDADIEIISIAYDIMKAFGASDADFKIRVNNRASLQRNLTEILKSPDMLRDAMRLIDRKEKISLEEFQVEWEKLSDHAFVMDPGEDINALLGRLEAAGVANAVYDPTLVRGFDYYTGTVFEVFDTDPINNRSIFGGGRYDNLLELFGNDKVPAVGFGLGDVTMRDFLETHGLIPAYASTTDVMVCAVQESASEAMARLAAQLRSMDIKVAVYSGKKKVGEQIQIADKKKIPFVVCIGENEVASGTYTLKELATGKEITGSATDIAAAIKTARL
jgi:histidyl-tRNA synthetase